MTGPATSSPRASAGRSILLLGAALGLASAALPWVNFRANRLVLGEGVSLLKAAGWAWALPLAWAALGALSCWAQGRAAEYARTALYVLLCIGVSLLLGLAGFNLAGADLAGAGPLARVSPAGGFWLNILALYVAGFGLSQGRSAAGRWAGLLGALGFAAVPLLGWWRHLGVAQEYANVATAFWPQLLLHLALSLTALGLALVLGLPLGVAAARSPCLSGAVLGTAGFFQTIPSAALFGLALPVFAALGRGVSLGAYLGAAGGALVLGAVLRRWAGERPLGLLGGLLSLLALQALLLLAALVLLGLLDGTGLPPWSLQAPLSAWGIRGIGVAPALLALTIYALLPIVNNTFLGLRSVPPALLDAAEGLGMTPRQVFWQAQWPLALPFIIEGVRSALVLTFGIATIAPLIGAGGLGFFIQRGVEGNVPDLVLIGALPIVLVALLLSGAVGWLGRRLTPAGLREGVASSPGVHV